ncbi:SDR family NAD(P)-dependent oxidoreductase [Bacillus gobiensis]|uniref:SDR family NAD(P)-dependent oxidoreductase n=1 Tax=Bacillus gobiensis TaxID=1441095 RepID=UPI003D258B96
MVTKIQGEGATALAVKSDIAKVSDIKKLFQQTKEHFGHIDILVTNAGMGL